VRLTRLRVKNVRRHADLAIDFAPGLNVVCGVNEAGKSTIQKAIEMVLFRSATSTAQELTDLRPWGAGPDDDPEIELEFDEDGQHGRLVKSFARSQGSVRLELGTQDLTDPRQVDQSIAELTGLPNEKFYRSTAGVRHAEIASLDSEDGGLRDRLQKSMSGGDRGTAQAKRRLDEVIRQYRTEGAKNPGQLKRTRDDIARFRTELAAGEAELSRLERDRAALATAHARRVALDERLADESGQLAKAEHAVELLAKETDAQARYGRFRRVAELRTTIARLERSNPSTVPLATLKDGVDRLRMMEFDISEIRAELASEPDPSSYQAAPVPSGWRVWSVVGGLLIVAAVVVAVAGLVGNTIGLALAALPVGVVALVLLYRGLRLRAHAADVRRSNQMQEHEVGRRLQGRSERHDQVRAAERERDVVRASLGVRDMAAAERLLEAQSEHAAGIEQLRAEERGLLGDQPIDGEPAELRDAAAAEQAQLRHALDGMGAQGKDPAGDRLRLRAAVETIRSQRDAALGEEGQARGRVEANDIDAETVAGVAERLTDAEERLVLLERRLRIYTATLEAIESAEGQTMQKAARFLEQHMGRDVAALTDGRYRQIRVDDATLAFSVFSPERGDWVPAASLSRGTLDQLYLAARLGLVRQLTGDRQPPLILDDPFITFDDARATRAVELLKRIAADFQVIYLTCSNRYDSIADRVIELAEPTARDSEAPGAPGLQGDLAGAGDSVGPGEAEPRERRPAVSIRDRKVAVTGPSLWDDTEEAR
jgi:DNA repair exonuclease SbcCD ATPase subunit